MTPGSDQLSGQEHENAAKLTELCRQEQRDNEANQAQAVVNSKIKDEDRVKEVGDFQAKTEARERGRLDFGTKTPDDDDDADVIAELETDEPAKKATHPKSRHAPSK